MSKKAFEYGWAIVKRQIGEGTQGSVDPNLDPDWSGLVPSTRYKTPWLKTPEEHRAAERKMMGGKKPQHPDFPEPADAGPMVPPWKKGGDERNER